MRRTRSFAHDPLSISGARRFAKEVLADAPSDVLDAVELMVSELATNSVRHAGTGFELAITLSGDELERSEIRIEVTDSANGTPTLRSPGPRDPTGRGLLIVELLSDSWGVEQTAPAGKTVWLKLAFVRPSAGAAKQRRSARQPAASSTRPHSRTSARPGNSPPCAPRARTCARRRPSERSPRARS